MQNKRILSLVLGLIFLMTLSGCSTTSKVVDSNVSHEAVADLSWDEAKARKARVSRIIYDLEIDLMSAAVTAEEAHYEATLNLSFVLSGIGQNLRLDFFEGDVKSLVVNGKTIGLEAKKKYWIDLPSTALVEGSNSVIVEYAQKYSRTGEGLHRFTDPIDKRVYLYTQFEPYDANRFMPCFDQPDLRAVLKLKVQAPKQWVVVTSAAEATSRIKGASKYWVFQPSAEISTYLFSLAAGPYAEYKETYRRVDKSVVPLRLFIRQSLKNYLKSDEWFRTSKDGLAYFENYFGVRYPFGKLDQLVVPEFNAGGMENVGAITYSEWAVPRAPLTRKTRQWVSGLLLHEIAHMWFGDLVTMAWWNDLWLNESFATYMSTIAQAEATDFKESWQSFAASTKNRAYIEDAMITTHPIEAPINRVKEAMTNFDGITYNKGASVLKQLNYYMTSADFRSGIREYFKSYAFSNTNLNQFIGSLQKHTKKDLTRWSERWLKQSGTDEVTTAWTCEGSKLRKVDVTLVTTEGRQARPQSIEVGLYKNVAGKVLIRARSRVDFEGSASTQTIGIRGDWDCPDFVYPNHDDHGYVLVKLDPKSLMFLSSNLSSVEDLTTRSMVWNDIWRMVRDTEVSLKTYVEVIANNFSREKDETILLQILSTIYRSSGSVLTYWPTGSTSLAEREKFVVLMETEFLRRMKESPSGSDAEKIWYDAFLQTAETDLSIEQLYKWYLAGQVSKDFKLDIDRQWSIASQLSRYQHPKAQIVLAQMKKKDSSDKGIKAALSVEATGPSIEVKKRWVEEFVVLPRVKEARSLEETRAILYALFPNEQKDLKLGFSDDFFRYLQKYRNSEEHLRVGTVLNSLLPLACEDRASARLKQKVGTYSDMNPTFKKRFMMSLEEDERCQRIRARSGL